MQGSTLFWLLALGATAAFLMVRAQTQLRRIAPPQDRTFRGPQRAAQSSAQPASKPVEAQRWEVETHEAMRAWSAQLDSKLSALQHFIRLAEQASTRLEAAIAEARYLGGGSPPRTVDQPAALVERTANQADALRASLRSSTARVADTSRASDSSGGERPVLRIHALADAGFDSAAIAHQVGSPIGEVELVLSLRRQAAG